MNFNERVYEIVRRVPKGKVISYGQVAFLAGSPRGARAVGWALHRNPYPWVMGGENPVPCHRVVNREGRLAPEFAFGGPEEQRRLLEGEGVVVRYDCSCCLTSSKSITIPSICGLQTPPLKIRRNRFSYPHIRLR